MASKLFAAIVFCGMLVQSLNAADPPRPVTMNEAGIVFGRLKQGKLVGAFQNSGQVSARYSDDNGSTWSEVDQLFRAPAGPGTWGMVQMLVGRDDEMHVFFMIEGSKLPARGEGERPLVGELVNARIDIGYVRSSNGRKNWSKPKVLWIGYTGALNSVAQLKSGRILLPFSYLTKRNWGNRGAGMAAFTFMGQYNSTLIYSDDGGDSWKLGTDLMVPVPDIVSAYGAVEPVVVELTDGRVWNLIRTQNGRFWESFSSDGAKWSEPRPSEIISSDSPAGLVRLSDGRIVLFCNNCLRYPYAYGGRQVLHAAISADSGRTWRGFREVGRDPFRNEAPPSAQDYGTAYPFPALANDDRVIFVSGQGAGRVMRKILDPQWLYETSATADFVGRAEEWSTFGTRGVEIAPHPTNDGSKALKIRKSEEGWPAAAVWNFPAGASGRLKLRLQLQEGFGGALIGLTDHFSTPFDLEDRFNNVHNLTIDSDGRLPGGTTLSPGKWHTLELVWNAAKQSCQVLLNDQSAGTLPVIRRSPNVCYLRLRSTAESTDDGGLLVESVEVNVEPEGSNSRKL